MDIAKPIRVKIRAVRAIYGITLFGFINVVKTSSNSVNTAETRYTIVVPRLI